MIILIADDEPVCRKKMHMIMKHFGECQCVETGGKAVSAFKDSLERRTPFDLITFDIMMPDTDGIRALISIRDAEKQSQEQIQGDQRKAKIMVVTSHAKKELIIACTRAGADNHAVKPFNKEIITGKLAEMGSYTSG